MSKDRNTVAKRQREVEKKHKAVQKRERRAKRSQNVDELCEPDENIVGIVDAAPLRREI